MDKALHVVMYHYVRDLPKSHFPRLKAMYTNDFRRQLFALQERYETATLESAMDFLRGAYSPYRDLCLLTFDDGLREHYSEVTPMLVDRGIQGIFFVITSCLQEQRVAAAHMNHFLMAKLEFEFYQRNFLQTLHDLLPHTGVNLEIDRTVAERTYRWDTPKIASFKYLFNFVLDPDIRDTVVKALFEEHVAEENSFSQELYMSWAEAKEMQRAGMVFGGHSHQHRSLATLSEEDSLRDLSTCWKLIGEHLSPQSVWPFCYPYGKRDSFTETTVLQLKRLGFNCSFSTEVGSNFPGQDVFTLRRVDCKDAPREPITNEVCNQIPIRGQA